MSRKVSSFNLLTGIDLIEDRIPILDMSSTGRARSRLILPQTFVDEIIYPLLSNFITNSETGQFYPVNNPSGYIGSSGLSNYVTSLVFNTFSGNLSTQINSINSGTGNFISQNQTGQFYPASNPSGFSSSVDLSGYATESYVNNVSGTINNQIFKKIAGYKRQVYTSTSSSTGTCQTIFLTSPRPMTDGAEFMEIAYTPTVSTNRLRVGVRFVAGSSSAGFGVTLLGRSGDTNARVWAISDGGVTTSRGDTTFPCTFVLDEEAGTTSPITYKVRFGGTIAGTFWMNRSHAGAYPPGISYIEITEYTL